MHIIVQPLNQQDAVDIVTWRYDPPYAMYSLSQNHLQVLLNPVNRYFSVREEFGRLIGYCCFGKEARVPGGEYTEDEPHVMDVGVGMNPEMVGQGSGKAFVDAILRFAMDEFNPGRFRVTIADFNERSQRTFLKLGFVETFSFNRDRDGLKFVQLERDAKGS